MAEALTADIDSADLPVAVDSLAELRDCLSGAVGALRSQADQIGQMRGMFDDEDDAIQNAVDDGEHAETRLENALAFVDSLIARRERLGGSRHVDTPSPEQIMQLHDDIAEELGLAQGEGDDLDATVDLSLSTTEEVLDALLGAARIVAAAGDPIEIAIEVDGGLIQQVRRVEGDDRPVTLYVHDHDIEGTDDDDDELGHLVFEDTRPGETSDCSLSVQSGEPVSTDSKFWTSIRSEAKRLELVD